MDASNDIFSEREGLTPTLAISVALHGILFASILIYGAILNRNSGNNWGGDSFGGDAMSATLVNSIPLPKPQVETQNIVANESKGLTKSEPKVEEKAPEAIPIPDKETKRKQPKPITSKITKPRPVEPEPTNQVPFGQGGPVSGPYGAFTANNAKGGFGFTGGNGDFGSKYAWYVRAVRDKVSQNWMKYEIDPRAGNGKRTYITFSIDRSGRPGDIQIEQSSGVPSVDISAVRALQRIDTFGALPNDYSGSKVMVEFWFDATR
jgi:periplasmic protein TonB